MLMSGCDGCSLLCTIVSVVSTPFGAVVAIVVLLLSLLLCGSHDSDFEWCMVLLVT